MRRILYLSGLLLFLSSCAWLNPSIMLKTGKGYIYNKAPDSTRVIDYKISPNDELEFNLYSNDGFKLIDITSLNSGSGGGGVRAINVSLTYIVASDGTVKLPVLGRRKLGGMSLREAELYLQEVYSVFYVKPFVILQITNRRVLVFPGSPGDAKVIYIKNNNTTLLEALALAGGLAEDGKAKQVKLIRQGADGKNLVFLMDLSTIKGLKDGNTVLQANDMIYVEPRRKYTRKLLQELTPIVSLIVNAFVLYQYTKVVNK